jgi:hypothetical protein
MDSLVLAALLLAAWGAAVVVSHNDRRSVVRFLPLIALAVALAGALLHLPEVVGIGGGLSCMLLLWTAVNTSPSLIPLLPFLPMVAFGIGFGLNWIVPWLGTGTMVVGHALVLLRAWRSNARDARRRLALVQGVAAGTLSDLACPLCGHSSVNVRFTHPADTEWRTWFMCSLCKFEMRTQNSGRPPHFSEDLIDPALEARDRR